MNYWEFSGKVIHVRQYEQVTSVVLEGATEKGYLVKLSAIGKPQLFEPFGYIGKYSQMSLSGHFETIRKTSLGGKEKEVLTRVIDCVLDCKTTNKEFCNERN